MKTSTIIIAAAIALTAASCSNEAPDAALNVTVQGSCKAGEPVRFTISGDADNIVFYSGEPGHIFAVSYRHL
ncbi:MAG: DUF5017 domain-containing protein, partial [Muribaculaceae bacterium]|nr:DUF5017 domain-containing protein [Muribaculaceae bacterium]